MEGSRTLLRGGGGDVAAHPDRPRTHAARVSELRFFAGLQESEIAEQLGVSEITVKRDWRFARAWLAAYLARERYAPRESGRA